MTHHFIICLIETRKCVWLVQILTYTSVIGKRYGPLVDKKIRLTFACAIRNNTDSSYLLQNTLAILLKGVLGIKQAGVSSFRDKECPSGRKAKMRAWGTKKHTFTKRKKWGATG